MFNFALKINVLNIYIKPASRTCLPHDSLVTVDISRHPGGEDTYVYYYTDHRLHYHVHVSTSDTVCDPTSPVARTYSVRSLCYTVVHLSLSLDLFPCSHMALLTVSDVRSFGIVQSQNARVLLTERCSRCM